ncbi:MAG: hypothetical protein EAY76_00210 [Alphaproteobacteria bacterium]|nr:MAG: hypothetical protein EAY76_00210 [Alphaproteobacteria bacterium]TAF75874.1 MAG: hypothetical protein EAZ52_05245 [Alphaproteobacteria bacterium]
MLEETITSPNDLERVNYSGNSYRSFEHIFSTEVKRLEVIRKWIAGLLILLFILIVSFPWVYDYCLFRVEGMKKIAFLSAGTFSSSFLLSMYLLGKTVGFLFLFSVFAWSAKIYSHTRRLILSYRDKQLRGQMIVFLNQDAGIDVTPYLDGLLEPILHAADAKKKEIQKSDDQHALVDVIKSLIETLKEKKDG